MTSAGPSKPDALAAAVFFNKYNSRQFKRSFHCEHCVLRNLPPLSFKIDDCGKA